MDNSYRPLINMLFTILILLAAGFMLSAFLLPLLWAAILAISSWPLFKRISSSQPARPALMAGLMTVLVASTLIIPLSWLTFMLGQELHYLSDFLEKTNASGIAQPLWLARIPFAGHEAQLLWDQILGQPQGLNHYLHSTFAGRLSSITGWFRNIGVQVGHRLLIFGFMLLSLFFFYRDGNRLTRQINTVGNRFLATRWNLYARTVPVAVRASVNGLVLVGLGEGLLLGTAYGVAGVGSPVLLGFLTALMAIVPFGAPLVFSLVALGLIFKGQVLAGVLIFSLGLGVVFMADHIVRPLVIGGATRLHFLLVLFGILGGVESMGLIGLFIGPVLMVLFMTLWREALGSPD